MQIRKVSFIVLLVFLWSGLCAQITPKGQYTVANSTTNFNINISVGNTVYNVDNGKYYMCISGVLSSETLTSAPLKFKEIPTGSCLTSYSETDPVVKAISGIIKSNGTTISAAVSGTDFAPAHSHPYEASGIVATHAALTTTAHGLGASAFHPDAYFATAHAHPYEAANANIQSHIGSAHQAVINGTGFVKAGGTTISYDNSSYSLSSHNHSGVYLSAYTETDPIFGAWNKSTGIAVTTSQISDFQTSVAGNSAVTANTAKLTNATHTGDATGSSALTLATVNSSIGTYNNVTINAKGLATGGSNVSYLTSYSETDPVVKAISGIIKSNGTTISAAVSGTDFAPAHSHPYEASGTIATHAALTTTAHGLGASAFHPDAYFATAHAHPYEAANANIQSHIGLAHQSVISGTGFVKAVGTTISYDNSSYSLSSHNHSGVYLSAYTETDPIFGAWNKSTGIAVTTSQISDFQTSVAGNSAVTANTAKLTNATHSGDATGSAALTLATVNSSVGTYNNVTINAKGLATGGSNVSYLTSFSETDPLVKAISGIIKSNGTTISAAVSGTDFAPAHSHPYESSGTVATHAALTTTAHGLGASAFHPDAYFATAHAHPYEAANANIQSHISSAHQAVINGTGFVKAVGTTISYDNSAYSLTSHNHSGVYLTGFTETDPTISAWAKAGAKPGYTYSEVGAASTSDGRLTDARVASDVYAWAKASAKPGYTWSEVSGKPTALSSFSNDLGNYGGWITDGNTGWDNSYGFITSGSSISGNAATATNARYVYNNGAYSGAAGYAEASAVGVVYANSAGSAGSVAWANVSSKPTALSQFSNDLGNYGGWAASGHNHSGVYLTAETDPNVYTWAKAATKPGYAWSEISSKPSTLSSFTNDLGNYGGFVTGTPWTGCGYITGYSETDPNIYAWAKAATKPGYAYSEISSTPTALSQFTNNLGNYGGWITDGNTGWDNSYGFITGYTETDPTISAWAKAGTKPTYSYSEVGAAPSSTVSFPGFGTTVSTAANGNHTHAGVYLTGYTETDPTIYAWAKAAAKPGYSYSEVGAAPSGTVSFPGFGTTVSTAANGNHTHAGVYLTSYSETDPNVSAWAKAASKPSYAWSEISSKPTNLSSFTNDLGNYGGWITGFTETDPTVYAWAKASTKPSYSASEVGLGNVNNTADASKSVSYAGTAGSAPANGGTSAACSGNSATATNFNNGSAYSSGGTVTAVTFTETSARKYKHDIAPMSPQMANIMKLNPVDYVLNLTGKKDKGFIADEIIKVYPEFADSTGVNYSKIVSVLVKGMQEQQLQIDQLKKEIELLKSK